MVLLLAIALTSSIPAHPVGASAQATATIRVLSAVQIKFSSTGTDGVPPLRDATVRTADGTLQPAKLVEFQ
jgi:hypothetical protein